MDWFCLVITDNKRMQHSCPTDWIWEYKCWQMTSKSWRDNVKLYCNINNITWSNWKVVQSAEKVLENETNPHPPLFFSLACHTVKCSKTQKQMSVKVISWGHKVKKRKRKIWIAEVFIFFFFFCAKHSSSLAARAANSRCLRLVLHQLCLGGHHQHRGTYASIFFHLDHTVPHPSVGVDSSAAFWVWLQPHEVGFIYRSLHFDWMVIH